MNIKVKLKKGDEVIVLAGKDKGKTGKITLVKPQINKAIEFFRAAIRNGEMSLLNERNETTAILHRIAAIIAANSPE